MSEREYQRFTQPKDREPDSFDHDLHPNPNAGINHGELGANPEMNAPSAADLTELHRIIPEFTNDELRRIVVLRPGDRLEQGATYLDLRAPSRQPFTATGNIQAGPENLFVPKSQVDYVLWNRLTGVDNPERLDQADD